VPLSARIGWRVFGLGFHAWCGYCLRGYLPSGTMPGGMRRSGTGIRGMRFLQAYFWRSGPVLGLHTGRASSRLPGSGRSFFLPGSSWYGQGGLPPVCHTGSGKVLHAPGGCARWADGGRGRAVPLDPASSYSGTLLTMLGLGLAMTNWLSLVCMLVFSWLGHEYRVGSRNGR